MEYKKENVCGVCRKLLCCTVCRKNHFIIDHPNEPVCPLCDHTNLKFGVGQVNSALLVHIAKYHLPLACVKCGQILETAEDLRTADPCCLSSILTVVIDPAAEEPQKNTGRGTHLSAVPPMQIQLTPNMPNFNSNWKLNSGAMHSSHTSITSNMQIRSTSTPEAMCVVQTTSQFMNGSGLQMSSICPNQTSELVTMGGLLLGTGQTPPMAPKMPLQQHKFRGKPRDSNVTPLRQVMSKNVQRALGLGHQLMSPTSQPLDLRTQHTSSPEDADAVVPISTCQTPSKSPTEDSFDECVFYTPRNNNNSRRSSILTCVRMEGYTYQEFGASVADGFTSLAHQIPATTRHETSLQLATHIPDEPETKVSVWNVFSSVFRFAKNLLPQREYLFDDDELPSESPEKPPSPVQPILQIRGRLPIARMRSMEQNNSDL